MTQTLNNELLDGQRKLLALAVAGANSKTPNPLISQLSNGPLGGLHEQVRLFLPCLSFYAEGSVIIFCNYIYLPVHSEMKFCILAGSTS